jgi:hypothetical protein
VSKFDKVKKVLKFANNPLVRIGATFASGVVLELLQRRDERQEQARLEAGQADNASKLEAGKVDSADKLEAGQSALDDKQLP